MTVQEAIDKLQKKLADQTAWEALYLGLRPALLAYSASLLYAFRISDPGGAQDVVQDVMLALFERWAAIRGSVSKEAELAAYLRRSCRNLLIDRYRRDRRAAQMLDFLTLRFSTALGDDAVRYREFFVREIIAKLPQECADLMRTYVARDLSLAEMAEHEGASPAAFYSRWYRCVEHARKLIESKKA